MKEKAKVSATETIVPDTTIVTSSKTPGRPILPNSKRQQKMLEQELKRQKGGFKKGRPANENSARQKRMAELETKRANGELKPGRPKYSEEEKKIAEQKKRERKEAEKTRIAELAKLQLENENATAAA